MDNENSTAVTEETARPVKKLVLKRKPVVKKTPIIKEETAEKTAASAQAQIAEPSVKEEKPSQTASETPSESEQAPKKRRGRSKQKAEPEKTAQEAVAMLNSDECADDSKFYLQSYYQNVYISNLETPVLTNDELPAAIAELREYTRAASTNNWTGIAEVQADRSMPKESSRIFTMDGKTVNAPQHPGLYLIRSRDGKMRKVVYIDKD